MITETNTELYHITCEGRQELEDVLTVFEEIGIKWRSGDEATYLIHPLREEAVCYIYTINYGYTGEHRLLWENSPNHRGGRVVMSAEEFIKMFGEDKDAESDISIEELMAL